MLGDTFDVFGIRPDLNLDVMTDRQTPTQVTYRILDSLSQHFGSLEPDAIIVQGDTSTTLAGAFIGFHHQIPVVHLEAGLRSGNIRSPFPEEGNRRMISQIAELHLAPTTGNSLNLCREGISPEKIVITGNTVIDALRWAIGTSDNSLPHGLDDVLREKRPILLASAHRRETWGEPLRDISQALADIASSRDVRIVIPVHRNPQVRDVILGALQEHPNVTITEPLPYAAFCQLMKHSRLIVSDSSGIEEEGPALGKPTLVLRDITERPEAVIAGTARLIGRSHDRIVHEVTSLLEDQDAYSRMANAVSPYGDGQAASRILDALARFFGQGPILRDRCHARLCRLRSGEEAVG
jgi:UDP-N-acetylglucosamine 2-epimerase (non-hydrolysing)